jgi:hypothetical protein
MQQFFFYLLAADAASDSVTSVGIGRATFGDRWRNIFDLRHIGKVLAPHERALKEGRNEVLGNSCTPPAAACATNKFASFAGSSN